MTNDSPHGWHQILCSVTPCYFAPINPSTSWWCWGWCSCWCRWWWWWWWWWRCRTCQASSRRSDLFSQPEVSNQKKIRPIPKKTRTNENFRNISLFSSFFRIKVLRSRFGNSFPPWLSFSLPLSPSLSSSLLSPCLLPSRFLTFPKVVVKMGSRLQSRVGLRCGKIRFLFRAYGKIKIREKSERKKEIRRSVTGPDSNGDKNGECHGKPEFCFGVSFETGFFVFSAFVWRTSWFPKYGSNMKTDNFGSKNKPT